MKKEITLDWPIQKLVDKYPKSIDILVKYGFHCIGCAMAAYETLGQGAEAHKLSPEDKKKLIQELNDLNSKGNK